MIHDILLTIMRVGQRIKNKDLNSSFTKQLVVKYVHDRVDGTVKPTNITKMEDVAAIKKGNYIVVPKHFGERSWMVFMKSDGYYYAVTLPKQNRRNIVNDVRLSPVEVPVEEKLYNGTIVEGTLSITGGIITFIIDEIYYLAGSLQIPKSRSTRMNDFIDGMRTNFGGIQGYNIRVCNFYELDEENLKVFYEKIKLDNTIQDVMFYPQIYGKTIYSYMVTREDLEDQVIRIAVLNMKKTKQPDAYELFDITSGTKIDIAIIPDMQTSRKCKKWFSTNKTDILQVKCRYLFDKKKWLPLEINF